MKMKKQSVDVKHVREGEGQKERTNRIRMKCPHCNETATFGTPWTLITNYNTPVIIGDDGKAQGDYSKTEDLSSDIHGTSKDECVCSNCNQELSIDEIELVEAEDKELAE
jgi:hypothetical protein